MRNWWKILYGVMAVVTLLNGYRMLGDLPHINFDGSPDVFGEWPAHWPLYAFGIFTVAMGVFGQLFIPGLFLLSRPDAPLRHPSWDRSPFDTLQCMRVFTVVMALNLAGALMHMLSVGRSELPLFVPLAGLTLGAFLGERLLYLFYARRIAARSAVR